MLGNSNEKSLMLKTNRTNLSPIFLALIVAVMTIAQDSLFHVMADIQPSKLPLEKYLILLGFLLLAAFIKNRFWRFAFLSFVIFANFFQMAHLSYFGTQILPIEIYLLFTQTGEIQGTLLVEFQHILLPLALTIIPMTAIFWLAKRLGPRKTLPGLHWLFIFYLLYNPVRTFVTGNTWGRQPSHNEMAGMNAYLSLSYFLGRVLPEKVFTKKKETSENISHLLQLSPGEKKPSWDHVIFILGESLTPHHMSLFGYKRPTTPYLDSLKENSNFYSEIGLSSGVSTDIALAFLLNMTYGLAGSQKIAKGNHCLLKLAKERGYKTHFLSIQSAQQLRYIAPYVCPGSLDEYKGMEEVAPETKDHLAARDRDLLRELPELLTTRDSQFIILHQRGSHAPWERRSTDEARSFPHDSAVNFYDNSVVEFDLFFRDLNEMLSKSSRKILLVYVSDHGEALGEEGLWGHGALHRYAYEVPIIIESFNSPLPENLKRLPKFFTHYNLSLFLAQEMGFDINQKFDSLPQDYLILGNDIDGFAGALKVKFTEDSYEIEKRL